MSILYFTTADLQTIKRCLQSRREEILRDNESPNEFFEDLLRKVKGELDRRSHEDY